VTPGPPRTRAEWQAWVQAVRPGEVRNLAGVRQHAMASGIGVSQSTLSRWETGAVPGNPARAAAWFVAVAELRARITAAEGRAAARAEREARALAAHERGELVLG
jgi:transcriptional regulator with XRE-family HTH domain